MAIATFQQLTDRSAQGVLAWALTQFDSRIALASSFGAEDMVLIDMLASLCPDPLVFTLDTGRLHEETYELIAQVQRKYPKVRLQIMYPDTTALQEMVSTKGINLFYDSVENRKQCCHVRKIEPLSRALATLDAWITGVRADQTATRATMDLIEEDRVPLLKKPIVKVNPLLHWTNDQVWEYIRSHGVPYNALHDRNFPSIGCSPCTRAIAPGEDLRAGRWWWELDNKECGLHVTPDGDMVRTAVT